MSCDDPEDDDRYVGNAAVFVTIGGMVLVIVGCLWPIEPGYVINPNLSAAENEAGREDFVWRRNALFITSAVGMGCLLLGGGITSFLIVRIIWSEERDPGVNTESGVSKDAAGISGHGLAAPDSGRQYSKTQETQKDLIEGCAENELSDDKNKLVDTDLAKDYGSTR